MTITKQKLVFLCGLPETGGDVFAALRKYIPNPIVFDQNMIINSIREYITSNNYEIKIIYMHCSAIKQLKNLMARGSERDDDKLDVDEKTDKFPIYHRSNHVKNYLRELSQVSSCLILDIEDDRALEANVVKAIEFINAPSAPIQINALANKNALANITQEEANGNCSTFLRLLARLQPSHSCVQHLYVCAYMPRRKLSTPYRSSTIWDASINEVLLYFGLGLMVVAGLTKLSSVESNNAVARNALR